MQDEALKLLKTWFPYQYPSDQEYSVKIKSKDTVEKDSL